MLRRVSTSFAAQVWVLFLGLADRLILVGILLRLWGTELYADWAIIFAAANLISMAELGLNVYFGNAWQRAFANKDEPQFQRFLSISLTIYLILTTTLIIAASLIAYPGVFNSWSSLQVLNSTVAAQVFIILAIAFALRILRGSISQIYRGRGQFAAGTIVNSLSTAALIIAVVVAAGLGASPVHIALIYLVVDAIIGLAIIVFDLKRRFPQLSFRPATPRSAELAGMVGHGKWYALLQAAPVAWLQLPILIISALGLGSLAIVSLVVQRTLVNFARQIPEMLARSVGVEAAGDFHLGDRERISRIVRIFGPFVSALTGAFAGGLFVFAAPLIAIWTDRPEAYNVWIVFWLLAPAILVAPATPLRNLLTLGNLPRPAALAQLVQLVIGLTLCLVLAASHGIAGAVAGLAIGEIIAIGIMLPVVARQHIDLDYGRYAARCAAWFAATTLWTGAAAWIILLLTGASTPVALMLSASLWLGLGLAPAMIAATPADIRKRVLGQVL